MFQTRFVTNPFGSVAVVTRPKGSSAHVDVFGTTGLYVLSRPTLVLAVPYVNVFATAACDTFAIGSTTVVTRPLV